MSSPKQDQPPRPADLAIVGQRLLIGLLRKIWELNYKQLAPGNMGKSLVLMVVFFCNSIATAGGKPFTVGELARLVHMPPNTVRSHIDTLVKHRRVRMVAKRNRGRGEEKLIIADLAHLDRLMTLEHVDWCIGLIEGCLNELKRLRELLHEQLASNGKASKAAE